MKKSIRKIVPIITVSLLLAGLTSCGNLFVKVPEAVKAESGSISGSFFTDGHLPSPSSDDSERTAFPTADFKTGENYTYTVTATAEGKESKTAEITNFSYTISELAFDAEYTITAEVKRSDGKVVLKGSLSDKIKLTKDRPSETDLDIELHPTTEGTGAIKLTVYSANSLITKVVACLDRKESETFPPEVTEKFNYSTSSTESSVTIEYDKIPSGGRNLELTFYTHENEIDIPVYYCSEAINVYDNLTTDQWIDNGDNGDTIYFSTENDFTKLVITDDCLKNFKANEVFVDTEATNSSETGSRYNPFKSIDAALKHLYGTEDKTIYIKNDSEVEISSSVVPAYNLKIEAYDSKRGDYSTSETKPSFTLTAENGYSFTVSNGKKLTVNGMIIASDTNNPQTGSFFTVKSGAEATFANCSFNNGNASEGGAVISNEGALTLEGCTFSGTNIAEGATAIQTGTKLTLKGKLSLGGYRIEASSETETINLDGTFTTGDAKIPLYFTSIDEFIGEDAGSPFTSDSDLSEVSNFTITGAGSGYSFNRNGKMVTSAAVGSIIIPTSFNEYITLWHKNDYSFSFKDSNDEDISKNIKGTSYDLILSWTGESIPDNYWQVISNKVILKDDLDADNYIFLVYFEYNGGYYQASFDVKKESEE